LGYKTVEGVRLKTAPASAEVIQKTKALMTMFDHPTDRYEPEPIGGSAASRIVRDHKLEKTKSLFEMFHLTT
jgi:hypothetical protein